MDRVASTISELQDQISGHFRQISTHLISKSARQTKLRTEFDSRANLVNSRDKIAGFSLDGLQLTI
jgi:hypothetical protein